LFLKALLLSLLLLLFAKPPPNHANFGKDASRGVKRSNLTFANIGGAKLLYSATYKIAFTPNEWGNFAVP